MALYQRKNIWYLDYYANGARIQESTGTSSKAKAEKFWAIRQSEVQRRVFIKETNTTLCELGERYLAFVEGRKRSWKRDVQMFNNLREFFGNPKLRDITVARIEAFQDFRKKQVAPATVNRETGLLKHMFFVAERWDLSSTNPVRRVKFLPENNLKFYYLSDADETKLLENSPPFLQQLIIFALNTGLRTSDIFNLKWEDLNLEERRIELIVKKSEKRLSLPLNDTIMRLIDFKPMGEYVFTNPMTGDRFKNVATGLRAAVKRAGLKKVTWHTFRHTFASRLIKNGVDIVTVKELLGHSTINLTMRYAHTNAKSQREGVATLCGSDKVVTQVKFALERPVVV